MNINKKAGFQKAITPWFKLVENGISMTHFRRRLYGFQNMTTLPGHRPDKAKNVLEILKRPEASSHSKGHAAYLRTICDGWGTKYRFQGRGACLLGCTGRDKLTHYAQ